MSKETIIQRGTDGKNRLVFLIEIRKFFGNKYYVTKNKFVSPVLSDKKQAEDIFKQQVEDSQ